MCLLCLNYPGNLIISFIVPAFLVHLRMVLVLVSLNIIYFNATTHLVLHLVVALIQVLILETPLVLHVNVDVELSRLSLSQLDATRTQKYISEMKQHHSQCERFHRNCSNVYIYLLCFCFFLCGCEKWLSSMWKHESKRRNVVNTDSVVIKAFLQVLV